MCNVTYILDSLGSTARHVSINRAQINKLTNVVASHGLVIIGLSVYIYTTERRVTALEKRVRKAELNQTKGD